MEVDSVVAKKGDKSVELELRILFSEYNYLNTDIQTHKSAMQSLTNQAIVFIAAAIPVIAEFLSRGYSDVLLFVPWLFLLIGFLLFEHDYQIVTKVDYKHNVLEPQITALVWQAGGDNKGLYQYPTYQVRAYAQGLGAVITSVVLGLARYLLVIVPCTTAIVLFLTSQVNSLPAWPAYQKVLFAISLLGLILYMLLLFRFLLSIPRRIRKVKVNRTQST